MADARIENFNAEVEKVLTYLHGEFAKLQTGRANAALVENVPVDAYGQSQPLKAVAGVSVQDAKTIVVQPWDASTLGDIETPETAQKVSCIDSICRAVAVKIHYRRAEESVPTAG